MANAGATDQSHCDGEQVHEDLEMVPLSYPEENSHSHSESFHVVYIWMPQKTQVGHASLVLSNGTYISLWPEDKKRKLGVMKKVLGKSDRPEDDIYKEGFEADYTFKIPCEKLDVSRMQAFWDNWQSTGHYALLFRNCCWIVYKVLHEGGAPTSATILWRPATLQRYLRIYETGSHWIRTFVNLW
ncbi:uncharacterized protein [Haliotis asinina]|uniref:uncharacterized protein n=1 Tax=Haliotis asinina TaxID=109174 RepID=UPI003531B66A